MRVTTAFNRLLKLDGVNVTAVEIGEDTVTVDVRLRRQKLVCPECGLSTRARYDTLLALAGFPQCCSSNFPT